MRHTPFMTLKGLKLKCGSLQQQEKLIPGFSKARALLAGGMK